MQTEDIIREFIEIVSVPSFSRNERAVCDLLKAKLEAIGLTVREDDAAEKLGGNTGNLIATLEGAPGATPVLFSSHMDRVPNTGRIGCVVDSEQGLIRSDGTTILGADDAAGLVAILDAVRELKASGEPHAPVEVVFTVSEEIGLDGASALDMSSLKARCAYLIDSPGRVGRLINGAPTICGIEVTVHGRSAHAGTEPEKGLNAIKVAADALYHLPEGRISPRVTSNFGIINAGKATNVVCDRVKLLGEARGTDEKALNEYLELVCSVFARTAEKYETEIEVSIKKSCLSFSLGEQEPVIRLALSAMEKLGITPEIRSSGGASDGNVFNAKGMPAAVLGAGYFANHTKNEHVYYEDIALCSRLLQQIAKEAL